MCENRASYGLNMDVCEALGSSGCLREQKKIIDLSGKRIIIIIIFNCIWVVIRWQWLFYM